MAIPCTKSKSGICPHRVSVGIRLPGHRGNRCRAQFKVVHTVIDAAVIGMRLQPQFIAEIAFESDTRKVSFEIHNVHRKGWIAGPAGVLTTIFDAELARTSTKACMNAIYGTFERGTRNPSPRETQIIAFFIRTDDADSNRVVCQANCSTGGHTVIDTAILARHIYLRRKVAAINKAGIFKDRINPAAKPRTVPNGRDASCNFNPVDQCRRSIMHGGVHRVWAAGGKMLAVDAQKDAFAR